MSKYTSKVFLYFIFKMISHPDIGTHGRLGNALFQYAAIRGLAKLTNTESIIPDNIHTRVHHSQPCQLIYFKLKSKYLPMDDILKIPNKFVETVQVGGYDDRFLKLETNILLYGHYENTRYFEHIQNELQNELQLIDEVKDIGKCHLYSYLKDYPTDTKIIGIHMRLGDKSYVYKEEVSNPNSRIHKYLETAVKQFEDIPNKIFICFTGGSRDTNCNTNEDTLFCKTFLNSNSYFNNNLFFSENNETIVDFSMLNQVDHMIILSHSTFSWWAGFLSKDPNRKVIVPKEDYFVKDNSFWHPSFIQL
jgi:hypothetical protein